IVNQILTNKEITVKDIKLLCKEEINHKVYSLNATSNESPSKTISELFENQVIKTPNEIALEFDGEILTYQELNKKSNQLASYLKEMGVKRESIVGIMASHSIELVIAILGVIKAGGAYLPIDPDYPVERINFMLEDSGSTMLLTNFVVGNNFEYSGNVINICDIDLNSYSKENIEKVNNINDLVYIIYTSGSTGQPKGVMIKHSGLTNYVWWASKKYLRDAKEVMALYSSIAFDLTVTSIFTPLISGNKIVIYENNESEYVLFKILRENKVTVLKLTPAHLSLIKDVDNSKTNIKRLIIGGEDLKRSLAEKVYKSFNMNLEIYNEYGPTETAVGCMVYKYNEDEKGGSVPIGFPIDNTQIYILDSHLDIVPSGISGELFIGGKGVARGYLNREDLTEERFIQNPYKKDQKIYRTGDIARYLDNDVVEYIGRKDNQVKIRGHRIEVGEIEKYLLENEAINDAIVAVKEDNRGNKILNAYIVTKEVLVDTEIKDWLLKFLPKYMIPINFIFMEQLPLTSNGKVNYALLPNPLPTKKEFVKHNSAVEKKLVESMEEILGIEKISLNDNFFQLGGDSIKAIQVSSMLKNIGLDISVKDILTQERISEIAATIGVIGSDKIISQDHHYGVIEPTPITEWFFNEKFHNENLYNQYVVLEFEGATLDSNKVSVAVNKLVQHHDALRINYDKESKKIYYNQEHLNKEFSVKFLDLSDCNVAENISVLLNQANVEFNIENSLLFNVTMMKLDNNRQGLLFTAHHLIVDGISWRIILNDFITILKQLESNEHINLFLKTHSFKEWAEQINYYRKENYTEEVNYWNSILEKRVMYPVDTYDGEDTVKTSQVLSAKLSEYYTTELINNMNKIYNIELNELLVISLVLTISRQTGNNEVMIELERHGREAINEFIDVSRTVGWFTSMYPTYFKIDHKNLEDNIKSLKEQIRSVPNKGFNYSILKYLNKELIKSNNKYIRFN
ncbi:amino acid adenylation domain-containing protein, partial [Bacillus mobilis]